MRTALASHDAMMRGAIEAHGGYVFATGGDGFAVAFARAGDAAAAAIGAQAALAAEVWPDAAGIGVRMALHTGEAEERGGDYFGPAVNRAARLMALGHGGQVLCSSVTAALLDGAGLVDLGEHKLRDLSTPQRVFQVGGGSFPPLRSLDAFPGNLPLQLSSFVGRDIELARVATAVRDARVVTLTGVGGVGKTRLALQAAAELLPGFREGAWLVKLEAVRNPDGVTGAFAAVFGVNASAGRSLEESLVDFLRTKQLLLVVDNCEHVLDTVGDLVELLERSCPRLVVLATSREGLALEGERVLPVPPLAGPPAGGSVDAVAKSEAVRLFVDRAALVDPEFALAADTAPAVAGVCRRLDGLPLAIELAAARVGAMTPAELAHALARRFDILAGGRRRAVRRHQTLRAAIDWSFELCSDSERCLLARLAVFAGGGTRTAVEAVCGGGPVQVHEVFELLARLVAKSLVVADRQAPDTRYRLLETIREYAEESLAAYDEAEALRDRHAEYYADFLHEVVESLFGPGEVEAAKRLAAEHENVLAAIGHAIDTGNADLAMRLLRDDPGVNQVGYDLILPVERALGIPGAPEHRWYPFAVALAAIRTARGADLASIEALVGQSLAAAERLGGEPDWRTEFVIEGARGVGALVVGSHEDAAVHHERAAGIARAAGAIGRVAFELGAAAVEWALAGDAHVAATLGSEGLALARQTRMPLAIAWNLNGLALALADSDPERARALLTESRALGSTLGYENSQDVIQAVLVRARLGDWAEVLDTSPAAVRYLHWNNVLYVLAAVVNVVARALVPTNPEAAAVLQGAARQMALSTTTRLPGAGSKDALAPARGPNRPETNAGLITDLRRQTTGLLTETLGGRHVQELRAEGEAMDTDHAVAYILAAIEQARQRVNE
jgi:predicted ATPase